MKQSSVIKNMHELDTLKLDCIGHIYSEAGMMGNIKFDELPEIMENILEEMLPYSKKIQAKFIGCVSEMMEGYMHATTEKVVAKVNMGEIKGVDSCEIRIKTTPYVVTPYEKRDIANEKKGNVKVESDSDTEMRGGNFYPRYLFKDKKKNFLPGDRWKTKVFTSHNKASDTTSQLEETKEESRMLR